MNPEILTAIISISGAVILAGAGYWFTKKREHASELRKEKLEHYKEFVACLSGIIEGESTADGQRAFARSCNKLNLVAPWSVIEALQHFQVETKATNPNKSREQHDKLMSLLIYEMRKDLGFNPADDRESFKVGLWASGHPAKRAE